MNLAQLQEEVMDFEIKDLDIIDGSQTQSEHKNSQRSLMNTTAQNSLILNELHKENEELQNKLKLNYRRLLLFETENNKLMEEKNKLFFETQNYHEKNQLLTEKNDELEKQHILDEANLKLANEKVSSLEKINKTQMLEIKRFAKFHTKIQDVVKPFIVQLKKQVLDLQAELAQSQKVNTNLVTTYKEFCKKMDLDLNHKANEVLTLQAEKTGLIQTYEEQIHSFSKEILDLQAKGEDQLKEIARLKKAIEFKNYFENEVIRFKRTHEEDQTIISDLSQKKTAAENKAMGLEQALQETRSENGKMVNKLNDLENNLEVVRAQFSKKIDELTTAYERINRLEKLNTQLSQEMSPKKI